MVDLVARVPRLPLAGETLFARSLDIHVGGKGANQAIAARRLGAEHVALVARVAADAFGGRVLETLEQSSVDITHVGRDPDARTGAAIPMVFDDGGNSIISAPMANMSLRAAHVEAAAGAIQQSAALLLQFEVPMECNIVAARLARAAGVPVFLNTAPVAELPGELLALVTILIANEVEAAALAPGSPRSVDEQALAFVGAGVPIAIVTLGAEGAVLATPEGVTNIPPFPVQAVDTVGAGDAFCGAIAVAFAEGIAPPAAARFASAAGALSVTRPGAAASLPHRIDVERLIRNAY